jgi:hypothetical protein
MKKVKTGLQKADPDPAKVTAFTTGAGAYAKKIVAHFKDYEFVGPQASSLPQS